MKKKTRLGTAVSLLLVMIALIGCDDSGQGNSQSAGEQVVIRQNEPGAWYEIYFTNPACPPTEARENGIDETIADDISQATVRVDLAAFDLDSHPIIDALIDLHRRGVEVRIVIDNENTPAETLDQLRRAGLTVVDDGRSALMHDKFIVIDGRFLWTGSLNFTSNGVYCNNNNIVRFDAPRLAANYTAEMDEMFNGRMFGPGSPENTVSRLNLNGVAIENYFAAEDDLAPTITRVVARADQEILFMAFSFTNEDIGDAIYERGEAGLTVRGVFETSGAGNRYSYYGELIDSGLPDLQVRKDGNPRSMHHKVMIIDRETVIFGSYNFTGNAETSNDENLLIVHDPTFAGYFVEEFQAVWAEAGEVNP